MCIYIHVCTHYIYTHTYSYNKSTKTFQIMHTKFRTVVTSEVSRKGNGTREGVTGNFHTNWAVLLLMLSSGYTLIVG